MIESKSHKFSKNSGEGNSKKRRERDSFISSVTNQKEKSASEAASSILEELGVKKSSSKKIQKNNFLNVKDSKKKNSSIELDEKGISILKDMKKEKIEIQSKTITKIQNKKIESDIKQKEDKKFWNPKNKNEKQQNKEIENFGLHEKFIFFSMFCLIAVSIMAYVGGYIKFDSAVFRQIFKNNSNQLEFIGEFNARQVENGYNRIPLFVVEGTIRNSFYESDNIKKIQLKAFAFDHEQRLIDNHFTYSGIVLSDEQLETLSPMNIKVLRQTGDLSILDYPLGSENLIKSDTIEKQSFLGKDIPFQVVFFKDVSTIKSTSIEVVSYVRNDNLVLLGSSHRE